VTLNNFIRILGMAFNRKVRRLLGRIQRIYRKDPNFSRRISLKSTKVMLWGEKIVKHNDQYIISSFIPPIPSRAYFEFATSTPQKEHVYTQQSLSIRSAPISCFLALTNACNFNCKHCSAKGRKTGDELTSEQWITVISNLQDMGVSVIGFTGGEPLMLKDLEKIIAAVDDRSVSILYTNGKGLTYERALEFKKNGLFSAAVSLDSHCRDTFNDMRNSSEAFDISVEAIKNSRKAGLYTMMQSVFTKETATEKNLFDLFKLGKELGVHEIRVLEPIRSGYLFDRDDLENFFFDNETRQKIINFQLKINKKLGYPKMTSFAHTESDAKYGCGAGTQHSYITPSGELLPCDFVPLSFGNVLKDDLSKIWIEMNKAIGIPKSGCFANKINQELRTYDKNMFPLDKELSKEICLRLQDKTFPRIYQIRQQAIKHQLDN